MPAATYAKSKTPKVYGLPKRPRVADNSFVTWAKLFALSLSLFFYLPVAIPLLLLARTRTGQLMALLVPLIASWPSVPGLYQEVPAPSARQPQLQIGTRSAHVPTENPAQVATLPADLASASAWKSTARPLEPSEIDIFAPPTEGL